MDGVEREALKIVMMYPFVQKSVQKCFRGELLPPHSGQILDSNAFTPRIIDAVFFDGNAAITLFVPLFHIFNSYLEPLYLCVEGELVNQKMRQFLPLLVAPRSQNPLRQPPRPARGSKINRSHGITFLVVRHFCIFVAPKYCGISASSLFAQE